MLKRRIQNRKVRLKYKGERQGKPVYTNSKGETFFTHSYPTGNGTHGKRYWVEINTPGRRTVFSQTIADFEKENKTATILMIGTEDRNEYRGRDFLGIAIGECKKIARKEFGKGPFKIVLSIPNPEVAHYAEEKGFKKNVLIVR
jgi:hypothetical protein